MKKEFNGYSFSWTQSYVSLNPMYQCSQLTLQEEIERLEEIDDRVELMDSYPEALAIIQKVTNGN